jgi:hypothetical protein
MTKSIIFILPKNTKRTLSESGWLFRSKMKVPISVQTKLLHVLNLEFEEEYLEIKKYKNEYIEMNITFTGKKITEIYLRTILQKNLFVNQIIDILRDEEVEVFVPDSINKVN